LAADLVQETMEKALKRYSQLRDEKSLDAWLFAILANCWRDHCRRTKNMVDINEVTLTDHHDPEQGYEESRIINRVHRAIAQLKQEHRQVVTLVDLEGMAYNQVAEILAIPIGTVMSRLCRARRQLKDQLKDLKVEDSPTKTNLRCVK
jgi:RNA polymerase sigma-70 factor (ECF subfamily)